MTVVSFHPDNPNNTFMSYELPVLEKEVIAMINVIQQRKR